MTSSHSGRPPRHPRPSALASALIAAMLTACGSTEPTGPNNPGNPDTTVSSVVVTAPSSIDARQGATLTVELRNAAGDVVSGTATWSSSNETVLTVSSEGIAQALLPGVATITVTSGSITGSAEITVELADMTAMVEQIRASSGLPAMGAAIVTIDGLVGIGVSGERRIGGPAVTLDDQWHIGSNLKAVTGLLCGIAVDQGVIDWDTTVPFSFPELTVQAEYQDVTLRNLCTNQSGLPGAPSVTVTSSDPQVQRNTVAEWAFESSVPAAPRETYFYSNVGFAMAGAMLERAWSSTYEDALLDELLDPIGVSNFGWGPQTAVGASNNPVPHSWNGSAWVTCEGCDNPPWLSAAGRMHIGLADWARIIQEMLRADEGTSGLIGAQEGQTVSNGSIDIGGGTEYGYGWLVLSRPWANGRTLTHSGSNTLNSSVVWVAPERDFAVLALTNAGGGTAFGTLDQLILGLLDYYEDGS